MLDYRPVLNIAGSLLAILAVAMLVPATFDLAAGSRDWQAFAAAAAVTAFVGVALILATREAGWRGFGIRQGFLVANLSWALVALFGALPFVFCELQLSLTDAIFESMSGITTTGATVLRDLETVPPGILLWRAILNWLGGIGIIVMALAVLPILQVGGMQLFRVETFSAEQVLPRAAEIGFGVAGVYIVLTLGGAILLWALGMGFFDAVTHAMTTISTGGFSTRSASVAAFDSVAIELALAFLMLLGAMPFVLLLRAARGQPRPLLRDSQVAWLLITVVVCSLLLALWLEAEDHLSGADALRLGFFTTVSTITGTGMTANQSVVWDGFPVAVLLLVMFVGGAAGSTTSGVKLFRVRIFVSAAMAQLRRLTQPHGIFIVYFNRRPVPNEVVDQVMGFLFLFGVVYAALAAGLGLMGVELTIALSAAASALANVGPGLGDPHIALGYYGGLPAMAKWWLCFGMLLGRLELLTLLVLFSRAFWRS